MVSVLGLLLAFGLYAAVNSLALPWLLYGERFDSYWRAQSGAAVAAYQSYVEENGMGIQDVLLDQSWSRTHPSTDIYAIYAGGKLVLDGENVSYTFSASGAIDGPETGEEDLVSMTIFAFEGAGSALYPLVCTDGELLLAAAPSGVWYGALGTVVGLLAALAGFCAVVIPYICHVLRRISSLSRETEVLMGGDLEHSIRAEGRDELAQLGESLEGMRRSVRERIAGEREALQANTQLITSLSHDLRTPLTKLMGYLEILNYHRYGTEQERDAYLRRATDTAIQLKKMGDQLFSRFQVEREEGTAGAPELVDGAELLSQILSEQCYDLQREDFTVEQDVFDQAFLLRVRTDDILRVFDNLFSNLKKYADQTRPIRFFTADEEGAVKIRIENAIAKTPNRADSHGIGLPTAAVLMERCGGRLETARQGGTYRCTLTFPKAGDSHDGEIPEK